MSKEHGNDTLEDAMQRLDRLIMARVKKQTAMHAVDEARRQIKTATEAFDEAVADERQMEEEFAAWLESQAQRFKLLELERKQKGE
jgi:hypothetical protein